MSRETMPARPPHTDAEPVTVRPARASDEAEVLALLGSEAHLETVFDAATFVVGERGGRIVATARLKRLASGGEEIASVAVAPALRGLHVGRRVAEAALARARGPVYALALAPGFFARLGFEAVPEAALPPELLTKARTTCASTGFRPMVRGRP